MSSFDGLAVKEYKMAQLSGAPSSKSWLITKAKHIKLGLNNNMWVKLDLSGSNWLWLFLGVFKTLIYVVVMTYIKSLLTDVSARTKGLTSSERS